MKTKTGARGDVKDGVKEFVENLLVCKKGQLPSGTKEVQNALIEKVGVDRKQAPQLLVDAGLKTRTVTANYKSIWAYVNSNGKGLKLA